ncbi:MAG: TolC family protein [Sedimentisphaerales bacterium]
MAKAAKNILPAVWLLLFFLAGCKSFNGPAIREKNAKDYQKDLTAETNDVLSKKTVFDLNDCIQIALANSLQTKAAKIQQQIAKLERKIAFANFLPAVNLDYTHTTWNKQPKINFGGSPAALQDQSITDITWQFQMSIFDPSTWFLYAMHQRGEETAELVTKYTMQITILDVIINYYHCLTLEQTMQALQSQLNAAGEFEKETGQLYRQGQVVEWQNQQAQVTVLARQTELNRTKYALKQAYADLLASMGLSPIAQIRLKIDQPLKSPDEPLEELVCKALLVNPQLQISDRRVAIEEEKVKVALAAFLPRISVFANRSTTSDSFQVFDTLWSYGFAGTMTVFNGFANINEYKAAKERRKAAFVEREQQTLVLILQVYKAYLNLENAKDEVLFAQKSFDVASKHFDETYEKWKEGQVQSSEMLSQMAGKDNAQMELMNSNFSLQVCIATLQNVMGTTDTPKIDEKKNESR